jgi:hypothetical protein
MLTSQTVDDLIRFPPSDTPVLSLYVGIPVDPGTAGPLHTRIHGLLDQLQPLADDTSLDRDARLSVRQDLERLHAAATEERWGPPGAAVFVCSSRGLYARVELPRAVRDRAVADATPYVRPLLAVLDEFHHACVVVVDREHGQVWDLYQGQMQEVGKVTDPALRKPNYGGWHGLKENPVRHRAEELAKHHYRNVAQQVSDLFRSRNPELLIVGGHHDEVPDFLSFLPRDVQTKLAGTFEVDPHTTTPAVVRDQAQRIVENFEREGERRRVAEVLEKVAAHGRAVAGLEPTLWAASTAAVQDLLVQEDVTVAGVVCDQSGWLGLVGETCPVCGARTRHTDDLLDELAEAVVDEGGSVEHVQADTPLKEHTVAAAIRFPLPPQPVGA